MQGRAEELNNNKKKRKRFEKHEIIQIRDLLPKCSYNTFVIFDLDNTVFESIQELGSDQWFDKLCEHAKRVFPNESAAIKYAVDLYHLIQHHTEMKTVEQNTALIIKRLQDIHIPVIALTARGKEIKLPTLKQLKCIDVDFSRAWKDLPAEIAIGNILFSNGIIFCGGSSKGNALELFCSHLKENYGTEIPEHILMVEDKHKHLDSVGKTVKGNMGETTKKNKRFCTGLRYGFLDEKVAQFKMEKAEVQLTELGKQLPEYKRELLQINEKNSPTEKGKSALQCHSLFLQLMSIKSGATPVSTFKHNHS